MLNRVRRELIFPLLLAVFLPAQTHAAQLYGIDRNKGGNGSDFVTISTNPFSVEKVSTDSDRRVGALAFHSGESELFDTTMLYAGTGLLGTNPASLLSIDPESGRVRNRGQVPGFDRLTALSFDGDGNLYGSEGFELVKLDERGRILRNYGFVGTASLTGLAFNPVDNTMYGVEQGNARFWSINLTSGKGTRIGEFNLTPAEEGEPVPNPVSIAFDDKGVGYLSTGGGGSGSPGDGRLFSFDLSNLRLTEIGVGSRRGALSAIVFAGGDPALLGDFDGNGEFDIADLDLLGTQLVFGTQDLLYDVNEDSTVNADDLSFWVKEIRKTWIGDSNLDGEFNSTDLVNVFQANKFEQALPATWGEGDWSGDGRFGSADLVAAFQDGGFEIGPVAASSVPEPSGVVLLVGGTMLIGLVRRSRS